MEWKKYLHFVSNKETISFSNISFRNKKSGWKNYSIQIDNIVEEPFRDNYYMQYFLRNYILRPSCYSCPTRNISSGSDITLGDFWGIDKCYPNFDDDKGVSLVIINSKKGLDVFEKINCEKISTSLDFAIKNNSSIIDNPKILHSNPIIRMWKKIKLKYKLL